jgi:hypothetical protein
MTSDDSEQQNEQKGAGRDDERRSRDAIESRAKISEDTAGRCGCVVHGCSPAASVAEREPIALL